MTDTTSIKGVRIEWISILLVVVFLGAVGLDLLTGVGEPRALLAFGIFITIPGALLLTLLGYDPRFQLKWLLYIVGVSLLIIMGVGLFSNIVLPLIGISRPMSPLPLGIMYVGLVVALSIGVYATRQGRESIKLPGRERIEAWEERWIQPTTLALLLLPPLTILSIHWLNRTSDNRPIIAVLVAISLLPLLIAVGRIARQWFGLAVGTAAISLLYHDSLHVFSIFSGSSSIIGAWETGRWDITGQGVEVAATSNPLLPNVTISPTFAHLGGINILTQIEVFNPLFVMLIPLGSFAIFRRFFDPKFAALGAFLVMFIHPFYFQLPAGGRAAMPVLFLVLMGVALTDSEMSPTLRQGLALGFAAAVVTAHYGASYFVMAGLGIALVFLFGIRFLDAIIFGLDEDMVKSDGGKVVSPIRSLVQADNRGISVIFVAFYTVMCFSWYLYVFRGHHFSAFFSRVSSGLISFLEGGGAQGGTTSRLTREYGTTSIELSRTLYIVLAALTAIGVLYMLIQRFVDEQWRHQGKFDEFFVLAIGMLGIFSVTFILDDLWGGGRPMAITFAVTALFAVVGVYALVVVLTRAQTQLSGKSIKKSSNVRVAGVLFASILAALLILNSGVAAATVLGGSAPSNVPLHPETEQRALESPDEHATVHFEQDVSMLAWLTTNADGETGGFVDGVTRQRSNDIYGPQIAARTKVEERQSIDWTPDLFEVIDYQGESYVVLPSYSVNLNFAEASPGEEGVRFSTRTEYNDISEINERLSTEPKIYSNGDAEIYRTVSD